MGRKGRWGGREYGAEGSTGRKAHPDTPASTLTLKLRHFSARREASTLFRNLTARGKTTKRSSVQSVLERNRAGLHLPTSGVGCSTKTPSVQIWSRKGQIWEEKAWLDVDATVGTLRVPACASHPVAHKTRLPWASPPFYRGTKHDRTMTQRRSYNPKRKNMPRERWCSM